MPLPEQTDFFDLLKLSLVVGVSPRIQRALLARFGGAAKALAAPFDEVVQFAGPDVAHAVTRGPDPALVERTVHWGERPEHHLLLLGDDQYPRLLQELADPPLVLYASGRVDLLNETCFAIVGARNATSQGRHDARAFARVLSGAGLCIVSGLAHGVDACAHEGGLDGRASSIAVMGTGMDRVYPDANRELAIRLATSGCLLTEFCLGTPPAKGNFPRRNRLISGLSRGVLVVEANVGSGSLITAHLAADQGRDVFAIPGSIHSTLSKGCHRLIKEGAKLVDGVGDILMELGLATVEEGRMAARPAHLLLTVMGFDPVSPDQIAARTGMPAAAIAAQLSLFEINGIVCALPGGRFQQVAGHA